ncbi:MAG TPA: hypothetical protein PLI95_26280 [Polyangiaceae bacterium]|nr:hypothetical protein [Polyangiaceae bacterium]
MTPVLAAVYEELVARADAPPHADTTRPMVRGFLERTGRLPADHPHAPFRLAAAWEDTLCRDGIAARIAAELEDPSERDLAVLLSRAHRGVFRFETVGERRVVHDLWSGASFLLVPRDDIGRAVSGDNLGSLCIGRVAGAADGCVFLPGALFQDPEATVFIEAVLKASAEREVRDATVFESLLHMDFVLRTMSRPRPEYAYRVELVGAKR